MRFRLAQERGDATGSSQSTGVNPLKSAILASVVLAAAALGLAACNEQNEPEEPVGIAVEGPEGVTVENAKLILPAVTGNPGVVYFDIANTGAQNLEIAAASVAGADNAMIHQMGGDSGMSEISRVAVMPGATLNFAPGGLHVMAMGLDDSLEPGETAEVTLSFANRDKISFLAEVRAAGDR